MKVKCDYCGGYIDEKEERCPSCGAVNSQYHRTAKTTPQTIEQLQDWYKARNLPPENTTRFFIGKNIKEPKAFGIYEENGNFIVYKNKSDGSRAVRYEGTDEAYAVNEIYLRLKEEILNQKNLNVQKRSRSNANSYKGYNGRKKKYFGIFLWVIFILLILFSPAIISVTNYIIAFTNYVVEESNSPHKFDYFYTDNKELYYYEGSYDNEWYQYDFYENDWYIYSEEFIDSIPAVLEGKIKEYRYDNINDFDDLIEKINKDYQRNYGYKDLSIYNSKNYINNGHHYHPMQHYYLYNDEYYYYLDDEYSSDYGYRDNSGWYKYDFDLGTWDYYCDYEDKEKLGEDLYYFNDDYVVYNIESSYNYGSNEIWNVTRFEDTDWYSDTEISNRLHQEEVNKWFEEHKDSDSSSSSWDWSSDSDWDWDSDSDWDSGGTDWDSDW